MTLLFSEHLDQGETNRDFENPLVQKFSHDADGCRDDFWIIRSYSSPIIREVERHASLGHLNS